MWLLRLTVRLWMAMWLRMVTVRLWMLVLGLVMLRLMALRLGQFIPGHLLHNYLSHFP
jgi:hypothetical protein